MKDTKLLRFAASAIMISSLLLISACSKTNSNPFTLYFYTTNKSMPPLYIVYGGKTIGKVPVLATDPEVMDSTILHVTSYDVSTEIDGVQGNGQVIESFQYTLKNDGSFKDSGGGYLLYDTWQKAKYNLLIRLNGQI